jgi:hypothetical protein
MVRPNNGKGGSQEHSLLVAGDKARHLRHRRQAARSAVSIGSLGGLGQGQEPGCAGSHQSDRRMNSLKPEVWVAIYAAIVSTGALFPEVRRWFESGPRLKVTLIPDGMIIGGDPQFDETDLIIVNVINRGDMPVLITNLLIYEMPTWWARLRSRPTRTFVVTNPQIKGYPRNVPSELKTAERWTGVLRKRPDKVADLHTGTFYAGVSISHKDKPFLVRIKAKSETNKGPVPTG